MGCVCMKDKSSKFQKPTIEVYEGKKEQGVIELKKNYIIEPSTKIIGSGAFGKVYKTCRTHDPDSIVAIKVLNKHNLAKDIDNIINEVTLLNNLDHPNIVKYFETYDDKKFLYLVMEHVDGVELIDKLTTEGKLNEQIVSGYIKEVIYAINYCHQQGVVHRDLKPENIMVNKNN